MNYLLLLAGAYLAVVNTRLGDLNYDLNEWNNFINQHNKSFESKEIESLRKSIFTYNKQQIDEFNREQSAALGFSLGVNHLTDVSSLEVRATNGFKLSDDVAEKGVSNSLEGEQYLKSILDDDSIEIPDEIDWRKVPGRVSRVKNQGQCGSCWAFASVGVLEGQEAVRKSNKTLKDWTDEDLIELSEQNLVDCVKQDYGCNGGLPQDALNFVKEEGGIDDEASYPYEARTKKCRFNKRKAVFTDNGAVVLPEGDEEKLKEVVAKFGPVAVAIDASSIWFQLYRKGVYYNKRCKNKPDELDHAVLVVGYGTDPKKGDYWIVKNSWGASYGESGYIRMARNRKNNCGIATMATIPIF